MQIVVTCFFSFFSKASQIVVCQSVVQSPIQQNPTTGKVLQVSSFSASDKHASSASSGGSLCYSG